MLAISGYKFRRENAENHCKYNCICNEIREVKMRATALYYIYHGHYKL
jgi:hypothetical protein